MTEQQYVTACNKECLRLAGEALRNYLPLNDQDDKDIREIRILIKQLHEKTLDSIKIQKPSDAVEANDKFNDALKSSETVKGCPSGEPIQNFKLPPPTHNSAGEPIEIGPEDDFKVAMQDADGDYVCTNSVAKGIGHDCSQGCYVNNKDFKQCQFVEPKEKGGES